jgi:hypothetical protein
MACTAHDKKGFVCFARRISLDSGFRPLLCGEIFAVLAGKLKRRHSSESWNPATRKSAKALDSSFRWNDELMALHFHGKFSMPGAMPAHFF